MKMSNINENEWHKPLQRDGRELYQVKWEFEWVSQSDVKWKGAVRIEVRFHVSITKWSKMEGGDTKMQMEVRWK